MSNGTSFSEFSVQTNEEPLTVESVFKHYAAYAGIHKLSTDYAINGFNSATWTNPNSGVVNINDSIGSVSQNFGTGAHTIWYDTDMPRSMVIELDVNWWVWEVLVRSNGSNQYYFVRTSTTKFEIGYYNAGTTTYLLRRPLYGGELEFRGTVRIAIRDEQTSGVDTTRTLSFAAWIGDFLLGGAVTIVSTNATPLKMGVVVNDNNSISQNGYGGIRVGELSEIVLFSSLDPNEAPEGAITRTIEDRYIKWWMRWDGSLRVYRPKARSVSYTLGKNREYGLQLVTDRRQIFTHIRILGAAQWVQLTDTTLVRQFGHRFKELNNPSLWNTDDCIRIGQEMFVRVKEQVFQGRMTTFGLPFAEMEDRITVPDPQNPTGTIDFIIDTISWQLGAGGSLACNLTLRQYNY